MKRLRVLIASGIFLCVYALGQNSAPESRANAMYWQQVPAPGPESASPPPDVFFSTQKFGDSKVGTLSAGFFTIADDGKPVTGAPYSATAITETTQMLADGNRIANKTVAFLARDSQGRTRREESMGGIGPLAVNGPKMAFITDPVSKTNYILDLNEQSAHIIKTDSVEMGKQSMTSGPVINMQKKVIASRVRNTGVEQRIWISNSANEAGQVKTESLGTQVIEGVSAEGKRVTRTIPAGQIGNERALEITSEVWTSPELRTIILSKRNDPRFGETVYHLTDIRRSEPDHSLFEVPSAFSIAGPKN